MSLVLGVAASHSPLLYRPRSVWSRVSDLLVQGVTQPQARENEDDDLLASYDRRISDGFATIEKAIAGGALDALIVLYSDRHNVFDDSNVPQLHMQIGGEVWADSTFQDLDEQPETMRFPCHYDAAEFLSEELVKRGFDLSEGRESFTPLGSEGRGIGPAVADAVHRIGTGLPIIPLHINCHVEPTTSGARLSSLAVALADVAALSEHRLGLLVSGGLSGNPGGPMAGWVDDVLDLWVLDRIVRDQADEIARVWGAQSRTLIGSSADIRLWQVAAIALKRAGCRARVIDYMPLHHAATGVGFVTWEHTS